MKKIKSTPRATPRRCAVDALLADVIYQVPPGPKLSRKRHGFRITVECLDDGARASFITLRTPFGLTISPSNAGRKVVCVLRNYNPLTKSY